MVDPDGKTVEVYTLREGGYELAGRYGAGSAPPGSCRAWR